MTPPTHIALTLSGLCVLMGLQLPLQAQAPETCPIVSASDKAVRFAGPGMYVVPIKKRAGRTPIIEVRVNGHRFEMIVDTGANDTVITHQMAKQLAIPVVAKRRFDTASAQGIELPIGLLRSLAVSGAEVRNLQVAIAGPELPTGLLGQDFLGEYDLTLKRDVIEFRLR
ncbi:MAG: retropepsin-like aspartic protease [Leptolyngbyaceae cyanobacterium bins.59]|nr:retropepsin-like aspartic protease [Leptolyngbyaceae cyanobacterium bins.59]